MCGIAGFISLKPDVNFDQQAALERMLTPLVYRGPDAAGLFIENNVALGMRRLAVIDLEGGRQPLQNASKTLSLVYNGELYNYRELRKQLATTGLVFNTVCDTEVILQAYVHFGIDCVQHFNGMFAFALWDAAKQQLFLARDRLGQKPLYLYQSESLFAFASDIRALSAHPQVKTSLRVDKIAAYLQYRQVPGPYTLLTGITCLPPGHRASVSANGALQIKNYWSVNFTSDERLTLASFTDEFNRLWPAAIQRHLHSDVPIGAFISGGIDSSLIVTEAAKQITNLKTFTIRFNDPAYDESRYASEIASSLGCDHHIIDFNGSFESLLDDWSKAYDQPFADPAAFPALILAKHARKQVTVALSGDGADELFGGYQRYQSMVTANRVRFIPALLRRSLAWVLSLNARFFGVNTQRRRHWLAVARRLQLVQNNPEREYRDQFHVFGFDELNTLFHQAPLYTEFDDEFIDDDSLNNMRAHDLDHWLPDQMLVKMDRASMASSLEVRSPFLDNSIIDLALRTPPKLLIQHGQLKYPLRQILAQRLPGSNSTRPKHGFAVPVDQWLRDEEKFVAEIIHHGAERNRELLNPVYIEHLFQSHISRKHNCGDKLLTLLLFFVWQEKHNYYL